MSDAIGARTRDALQAAGVAALDDAAVSQLSAYVSLILRWNGRMNLTAIRDEVGIVSRHIVESVEVSYLLPGGISTLLDYGSGAGLPGIPIAICRPEIEVTLAESQNRKAAFLMEAVRILGLKAKVHSGRAEEIEAQFECVTLRAVDKMGTAVSSATELVAPRGWLALMTTTAELQDLKAAAGSQVIWQSCFPLCGGERRVLALGKRANLPN